jgi:hypothetical protein
VSVIADSLEEKRNTIEGGAVAECPENKIDTGVVLAVLEQPRTTDRAVAVPTVEWPRVNAVPSGELDACAANRREGWVWDSAFVSGFGYLFHI